MFTKLNVAWKHLLFDFLCGIILLATLYAFFAHPFKFLSFPDLVFILIGGLYLLLGLHGLVLLFLSVKNFQKANYRKAISFLVLLIALYGGLIVYSFAFLWLLGPVTAG